MRVCMAVCVFVLVSWPRGLNQGNVPERENCWADCPGQRIKRHFTCVGLTSVFNLSVCLPLSVCVICQAVDHAVCLSVCLSVYLRCLSVLSVCLLSLSLSRVYVGCVVATSFRCSFVCLPAPIIRFVYVAVRSFPFSVFSFSQVK